MLCVSRHCMYANTGQSDVETWHKSLMHNTMANYKKRSLIYSYSLSIKGFLRLLWPNPEEYIVLFSTRMKSAVRPSIQGQGQC